MKAILEFSLPEESEAHDLAVNGWKWKSIVKDLLQYINELESLGETTAVEKIKEEIVNGLQTYNVEII